MTSRIAVRFFTVAAWEPGQPTFENALKKIMTLGQNVARDLGDGVVIQSGNLKVTGHYITGDLLRIQGSNFPTIVKQVGTVPEKLPMTIGSGLGYHAAFRYDTKRNILAYQLAKSAVPLGLLSAYLANACDCQSYGFYPVLRASKLKELNSMVPRTLLIKVADPAKLEAIESDQKNLRRALLNLRSLADGAYVKVQIGLGNRKGVMHKPGLRRIVGWLLEQRDRKAGKVRTIKVIGKDQHDSDVPLDFISAQLGGAQTIDLDGLDPSENYAKRAEALEAAFEDSADELKNLKSGPDKS
jgi:hypothetical protein